MLNIDNNSNYNLDLTSFSNPTPKCFILHFFLILFSAYFFVISEDILLLIALFCPAFLHFYLFFSILTLRISVEAVTEEIKYVLQTYFDKMCFHGPYSPKACREQNVLSETHRV